MLPYPKLKEQHRTRFQQLGCISSSVRGPAAAGQPGSKVLLPAKDHNITALPLALGYAREELEGAQHSGKIIYFCSKCGW